MQVFWSSAHHLHLAEVQETGEKHTHSQTKAEVRLSVFLSVLLPVRSRVQIQEGSDDISIESNDSSSRLTIGSGQQEHCGCYTIELKNSYGLRQAALNLTIVGETHLQRLHFLFTDS